MPPLIQTNIPLGPRTTLGVGGVAEFYCEVSRIEELREVCVWARTRNHHITILGGGSNILVDDSGVQGLVIKLGLYTIEESQDVDVFRFTVGAGVVLDEFVALVTRRGIWGIENLSGIPGTIGAVPIQNVGAYGVEVKESIDQVAVYEYDTDTTRILSNEECAFAYRDSIFKHEEGKRYAILSVTFCFKRDTKPRLEYKDLKEFFRDTIPASPEDVRNAVLEIRSRKFPDWNVVGTAGSFFKNPIISAELFAELQQKYPNMPGYAEEDGRVKVSLGWILEHVCGLRGYCEESVCLYEKQALVLVCAKGTSSDTLIYFSNSVIEKVFSATGIKVEREVTILK